MTRIARQAEPLRVVGDQFEGHIFLSLMVSGHEKARSGVDRAFKSRNRVDTYSSQDIMAENGRKFTPLALAAERNKDTYTVGAIAM